MPPQPRIKETSIEVTTTLPGVQVTLDIKQAAVIRDLFANMSPNLAKSDDELATIKELKALFYQIGGMPLARSRLYLFAINDNNRF